MVQDYRQSVQDYRRSVQDYNQYSDVKGDVCLWQPDVIVHCAAERRPDVVERHTEAAVNLNVHATSTLAKEAGR